MKTDSIITMFSRNILDILIMILIFLITIINRVLIDPVLFLIRIINNKYITEDNINTFYRDKVILITGASSGIGEALAHTIIQCNPACLIIAGRNQDTLNKVIEYCKTIKPDVKYITWKVDLEKYDAVEESFRRLEIEYPTQVGSIHVLINNAGISSRGGALESSIDTIHKLMSTNFYSVAILTRLVANIMINRNISGSIAVITSIQGKIGLPYRTSYSASKHSVQAYYDGIRGELLPYHITTTVISPGYVSTQLSQNAINADGSTYGKTDENTAKGMKPAYVAMEVLLAIANREIDVMIADVKSKAAVYLKNMWPGLLAKMVQNRK